MRPEITSALITWTPPSDSDDIEVIFQLMYYPIVFPERDVLVNVTSTSYHAVGLIPSSNYRFQVRLLLSSGPSTWTTANVTLHERIRKLQIHKFIIMLFIHNIIPPISQPPNLIGNACVTVPPSC